MRACCARVCIASPRGATTAAARHGLAGLLQGDGPRTACATVQPGGACKDRIGGCLLNACCRALCVLSWHGAASRAAKDKGLQAAATMQKALCNEPRMQMRCIAVVLGAVAVWQLGRLLVLLGWELAASCWCTHSTRAAYAGARQVQPAWSLAPPAGWACLQARLAALRLHCAAVGALRGRDPGQ